MKAIFRTAAVLFTAALTAMPAAAAKLPRPAAPEDVARIAHVSSAAISHPLKSQRATWINPWRRPRAGTIDI